MFYYTSHIACEYTHADAVGTCYFVDDACWDYVYVTKFIEASLLMLFSKNIYVFMVVWSVML